MRLIREEVFTELAEAHGGICPCYVCGQPVPRSAATLEHVIERCRGGTDSRGNLSISHQRCNVALSANLRHELMVKGSGVL